MDKRILEEIGLSGNEVDIYLALLKIGPSLVSKIVEATGINRTNIYDRLERMIDKGIISYVIKNNRKHFYATDPKRLLVYLDEKRAKIELDKKNLQEIIPELEKIKPSTGDEQVEVFEGKEGLKTILEDILNSKQEVLTYGSEGNFSNIMEFYHYHYMKRLEKLKIKMKVIFNKGDSDEPFDWKSSEVRYLPKDFKTPTETTIYGDNVVIFVFMDNPRAILIKSKAIADSYKKYFNILWRQAKK